MNLEQGQELHGFTVLTAEPLPEIDGDAYTLSHPVSGAKLLYLRNDDRNKAFSIAFRTPPADDTGVFHILEHSVLCGSEKFPVKEPFVNLLKTSMQTFLNAMTFGDKTLYPVASTNHQHLTEASLSGMGIPLGKKAFYNILIQQMNLILYGFLHPFRESDFFHQNITAIAAAWI